MEKQKFKHKTRKPVIKEMYLVPSDILYSQGSISNKLSNTDTQIGVFLDDIVEGRRSASVLNDIEVIKSKGKYMSANNRRLWILKRLEILGIIETVRVKLVEDIVSHPITSLNGGRSIDIRGGHPGGRTYDLCLLKDAGIILQNKKFKKKPKCQAAIDKPNTDSVTEKSGKEVSKTTQNKNKGRRVKKHSKTAELTTKDVLYSKHNSGIWFGPIDKYTVGSYWKFSGEPKCDTSIYCPNSYGTEYTDDFFKAWIRRTEYEHTYNDHVSNKLDYLIDTDSYDDPEEGYWVGSTHIKRHKC